MARYSTYRCTSCTFQFKVSGPHEFIREGYTIREIRRHQATFEAGDGVYQIAFCTRCKKSKKVINFETMKRMQYPLSAGLDQIKNQYRPENVNDTLAKKCSAVHFVSQKQHCPDCGKQVFGGEGFEEVPNCPACKGKLKLESDSWGCNF